MTRIPLEYQERKASFYESELYVDERVLIPRPETELLVETASGLISERMREARTRKISVLDIGTGSGNIAISLTKIHNLATMVACDISAGALAVAQENAARHGCLGRIRFIQSDLFSAVEGVFDLIVSNPPYVASEEYPTLAEEVLREPREALDGGPGGLFFITEIIRQAPRHLSDGGILVMEIGYDQSEKVRERIDTSRRLRLVEIRKDYGGIDRIVVARAHG